MVRELTLHMLPPIVCPSKTKTIFLLQNRSTLVRLEPYYPPAVDSDDGRQVRCFLHGGMEEAKAALAGAVA